MDKNAIKKYAVWARRELISRVSQKAQQYGITEDVIIQASADTINGHVLSATEKAQRQALIVQIQAKGYKQVMEEVAYTWFNRFSALRFMEVNGYLPSRVRVFTDENNQFEPQIIAEAIDLEMDGLDMEKVYAYKDANDKEGLFKYLIIVQCNALSPIMPGMFQRIADYTELLFPDNLLREGSAIQQMIELIPEKDWKDQVQIIGWLYQFYNIEPKAEVFAKKTGKISKEEIPAATQLFTPDWIVRYMVENSLGRLWIERNAGTAKDEYDEYPGDVNELLLSKWKYYLFEAEHEPEVQAELRKIRKSYVSMMPGDIECIDPCCGSGHILAYMFDVLMQIYESFGYTPREAVRSIVENNIYGLDIDERAAQLAYFSVMMKARKYDKRFLTRKDEDGKPDVPQPRVYEIVESNSLDRSAIEHFVGGDPDIKKAINSLIDEMRDAKEYGSILNITPVDFAALYKHFDEILSEPSIFNLAIENELLPFIRVAEVLALKYDVVVTNPPYMGVSAGSGKLNEFVRKNYPDSKTDLFAVFIERCKSMTRNNGYQAMITMHSWMFLTSYDKLRVKMQNTDITSMIHLGARAFEEIGGEVVQTTSFVLRKSHINRYKGVYHRLIDPVTQQGKEDMFLGGENRYIASQASFSKLPSAPVAYWVSDNLLQLYKYPLIGSRFTAKEGVGTRNDEVFLKQFWEVSTKDIGIGKRWVLTDKAGSFRKWYLGCTYVMDWENDGFRIKNFRDENGKLRSRPQNTQYLFKPGISWGKVGTGASSFRFRDSGFAFNDAAPTLFGDNVYPLLAALNTRIYKRLNEIRGGTMNMTCGVIEELPILGYDSDEMISRLTELVSDNIRLSKTDWDSFETSWDFECHPLINMIAKGGAFFDRGRILLAECYDLWNAECNERFAQLKANEEELNRIFIDIYGLQDELTPEVEEKDVTVRKANLARDIRSFISYAVGCIFGRYSLDVPGLAYAGGEWDESKYTTFCADKDNILPICDDEYFKDDAVGLFVKFVERVYGEDTLEANLRFIADALGGKGAPRDVIRSYFLNDFYADHLKIYQKRPIYWLFDSGKKNGFKALVYMHRYREDTIARMRTDYVHEQQARYRTAIADLEQRIAAASTSERVKLSKRLKTLQEQAAEIQGYEEKIHHLADQYIAIDLDDGVKKNYEIFKDVLAKIK